jgi:hypothetical protein
MMNLTDWLIFSQLILKQDLRLRLLVKMKLQKLFLIHFSQTLLSVQLIQGTLFNGISEQRPRQFKRAL